MTLAPARTERALRGPREGRSNGQWAVDGHEPLNGNEVFKAEGPPLEVRERIETIYAKEGFDADELKRAKDYLKGRMTLGFEDSEELGHFFGRQQLLYPKVRTIEEYMACVDAVTLEQLNGLG